MFNLATFRNSVFLQHEYALATGRSIVNLMTRSRDIHGKTNCAGFNGIFSYAGMGSEMAQRNMKLFADAVLPEIRQLGSTPLFAREVISEPEFVSARHRAA